MSPFNVRTLTGFRVLDKDLFEPFQQLFFIDDDEDDDIALLPVVFWATWDEIVSQKWIKLFAPWSVIHKIGFPSPHPFSVVTHCSEFSMSSPCHSDSRFWQGVHYWLWWHVSVTVVNNPYKKSMKFMQNKKKINTIIEFCMHS